MLSARPIKALLKKLVRHRSEPLRSKAIEVWDIAPAVKYASPPAVFLPGQLDRIRGFAFAPEDPLRVLRGGYDGEHGATRAFLLKDLHLVDGILHGRDAAEYLARPQSRAPRLRIIDEFESAAIYGSGPGDQYFGQWLIQDCATYPLAASLAAPVTVTRKFAHADAYERALDMSPIRTDAAYLKQAIVFDDIGQNASKRERFAQLRAKLNARFPSSPHPGVFIWRGQAGDRRVLTNERDVAEHLRTRHGFRIVNPQTAEVETIWRACAGARIVAGVEGSHLAHGLMMLSPQSGLLTLQPPNRVVTTFKDLTDRDGQQFGLVVGEPAGADFTVSLTEIDRTLELFA